MCLTPQLHHTWTTKSTKDISLPWTMLYVAGMALMAVYMGLLEAWVGFVGNIVEMGLACVLMAMKIYIDRQDGFDSSTQPFLLPLLTWR